MAFVLNSIIQIGAYAFRGVHETKIAKSIHSITDTCNITIPATGRLNIAGKLQTESVQTAHLFQEDDKVIIQLGYNGSYKQEFIGFVRRINLATPVVIECEGYVHQLRNPLANKTFTNTTLKAILQYIIIGTDITLSSNIPDFKIDKKIIKGQTGAEILEELKKDYPLTIFFYDNELFAGLEYTQNKGTVNYQLGYNVIRDNQLKLRLAGDVLLKIVYIGIKKDGTKVTVSAGDNTNNIKKFKTHEITDEPTLQGIANTALAKEKYTGYEGKISAFGEPFCAHAWQTNLTDKIYPERAGTYFIDSVEILYNRQGYRRIPGPGVKLS